MAQSLLNGLVINKTGISVLQINLGNRCNQVCRHCHVFGSPSGMENMDLDTAKKICQKISGAEHELSSLVNIEFTGGAPEMNPNLIFFIEELSNYSKTVRTNLTILDNPQYEGYIDLYKKHKIRLIASLPCVTEEVVDKQRGSGVFNKSIKVLRRLNESGFGTNGLSLDLVYNPASDFLPPDQKGLELFYKNTLMEKYNIKFNNLFTMVNSPINRFEEFLKQGEPSRKKEDYLKLLKDNHNPKTIDKIMCKDCITINYQGHAFDCDFNLALGLKIKGSKDVHFWDMDLNSINQEIVLGDHCYACTVNQGSSCHGALIKETTQNKDNSCCLM